MTFVSKFRKANSKIAASSVQTYLNNIKRLSRLAKTKTEYPETGAWLSKKGLAAAVRKLSLNAQKILAASAVKASKIYGTSVPVWEKIMRESSEKYEKKRDSRGKTKREKTLWQAYDKVYPAGLALWKKLPTDEGKWTMGDLRKAQKALLLLWYGTHTPRLLESLKRPGKSGPNQLSKTKAGFKITLRDYKTAKSRGPSEFKLDKKLAAPTRQYLKALNRLVDTDFLFFNAKNQKLSKPSFSKLLTSAMRSGGLKGVSAQLLRVYKATANKELIDKANELEQEMGHGGREQKRYSKK